MKTNIATIKEEPKTPKLRFSDFSDEWEEDKLENIADVIMGQSPDSSSYNKNKKGKYLVQGNADILDRKTCPRVWTTKPTKECKKDDIIMTVRAPVGYIARSSCDACIGRGVSSIRNKKNSDLAFLFQFLLNFEKKWVKFEQGSTFTAVNSKDVKNLKLNIPTLPEQQKIAEFLGTTDKWIENLQAQKKSLEVYKKDILQKIFSREIRFKDDKGKDFPEWEEKRLEEMGEIVGGGTPDTRKKEYWNGEINWFTPTEIKNKYIYTSVRKISKAGLKNSSARLLPVGTVLFTSRATIGDVSVSIIECATNQGFQSIIANKESNNNFLYYWIIQNKKEFLIKANGSTFLEVSGKEVKKLKSFFPSLSEQQKIAEFLISLDNLIESKQGQIEKTEEWKRGLMQGLFV